MTVVEQSATIDAPVEDVYSHCESPDFLVDLAPSAKKITDVESMPDGGTSLKCVHEVRGQRFAEECELTWSEPDKQIVETSDSALLKTTTTYRFQPTDGATNFSITAELSVPIPLVGKAAEILLVRLLLESELEAMVANLKEAAETDSADS